MQVEVFQGKQSSDDSDTKQSAVERAVSAYKFVRARGHPVHSGDCREGVKR